MKNLDKLEKYIKINDITFHSENMDYLSLFPGFRFKEFIPTDDQLKKIQPFFVHLKEVLSANNIYVYNYLLDWLSFIVQNPGKKTKVCIIFIDKSLYENSLFPNIIAKLYLEYLEIIVVKKPIIHLINLKNI